ncbi:MAG TPA: hypothetical protein VMU30_09470 [Bacteroidota bacterium]|nr:hypothetical protein [Bacteroidota bacterium]
MKHPIGIILLFTSTIVSFAFSQQPISASERQSVDLTIYNSDIALVREERTMTLSDGLNTVIVPDIPATIDGTSLHFSSLTEPKAVNVLEQNYQYDVLQQNKIYDKYIGKEVYFCKNNPITKIEDTIKATLLSYGPMIAEINGKIEMSPQGRLSLPSLPEGLILKPQLKWLLENSSAGKHKTEISYLAAKINWDCNYVVLLDANDTHLDLTGWVTITNHSGSTFKNTGLKLVAGDVNRIPEPARFGGLVTNAQLERMPDFKKQFEQKELFEYKLYSLQRKTDINNDETKQIQLTSAHHVTAKKMFIFDGMNEQWRYWRNNISYRGQGTFGQESNTKVGVFIAFKNDEKSGLGMPLPKGKVRVYKRDDDGKEQFAGEDEIDHTPKDEEMKLYLGNAFDLVGERAQKDFHVVVSGHVVEETFEIKLRNHKTEPVEIFVYEHPWRWNDWDIKTATEKWEKVDQSTVRFPVKLQKDEERTITYTIRYTW